MPAILFAEGFRFGMVQLGEREKFIGQSMRVRFVIQSRFDIGSRGGVLQAAERFGGAAADGPVVVLQERREF